MTTDERVVIMSAVRYMLGRSSYGVGSVCDYLKLKEGELTESNKSVILKDIKEFIEENPEHSHNKYWLEIVDLLSERLNK